MTVVIARRRVLVGMGGAALVWPIMVCAAKEQHRIGWLSGSQSIVAKSFADEFLDGMHDFSCVEGRDFELGFQERLPRLAE
jgi:hypothetical protein